MKQKQPLKERASEQIALHVSIITILWNIILAVFKLFAGIFAHSGAMLSDAVHSAILLLQIRKNASASPPDITGVPEAKAVPQGAKAASHPY